MQNLAINIIGGLGAALILFGFYRTSIGQWTGKSLWYELDNVVGAAMLIIYQMHVGAYVSVTLNVVWGLVALKGATSIAQRQGWGMDLVTGKPRPKPVKRRSSARGKSRKK